MYLHLQCIYMYIYMYMYMYVPLHVSLPVKYCSCVSGLCVYTLVLTLYNVHVYAPHNPLQDLANAHGAHLYESFLFYYTAEVLQIVASLHHCGILHADIKPDNLLLTDIRYSSTKLGPLSCNVYRAQLHTFTACTVCAKKNFPYHRSCTVYMVPTKPLFDR